MKVRSGSHAPRHDVRGVTANMVDIDIVTPRDGRYISEGTIKQAPRSLCWQRMAIQLFPAHGSHGPRTPTMSGDGPTPFTECRNRETTARPLVIARQFCLHPNPDLFTDVCEPTKTIWLNIQARGAEWMEANTKTRRGHDARASAPFPPTKRPTSAFSTRPAHGSVEEFAGRQRYSHWSASVSRLTGHRRRGHHERMLATGTERDARNRHPQGSRVPGIKTFSCNSCSEATVMAAVGGAIGIGWAYGTQPCPTPCPSHHVSLSDRFCSATDLRCCCDSSVSIRRAGPRACTIEALRQESESHAYSVRHEHGGERSDGASHMSENKMRSFINRSRVVIGITVFFPWFLSCWCRGT